MKTPIYFFFICGLLLSLGQPAMAAGWADKLLGIWEGPGEGFGGDQYERRQIRITFMQAEGYAAFGSKQWRAIGGEWSAPEPVQAILQQNGIFSAVDSDGYMNGKLANRSKLTYVYMEANLADPKTSLNTLKRIEKR